MMAVAWWGVGGGVLILLFGLSSWLQAPRDAGIERSRHRERSDRLDRFAELREDQLRLGGLFLGVVGLLTLVAALLR